MHTVARALSFAIAQGIDRLDAQMLVLWVMGQDIHHRAWLVAHEDVNFSDAQEQMLRSAVSRRLTKEPLAYITGGKEFYGLRLQVDCRVLVPRPDTETLVEWALELIDNDLSAHRTVLDLGTGSGAIALALKHERPHWNVHAADISAEALQVAQSNSQALGLDIQFHSSTWFTNIPTSLKFTAVVSNPPYIASGDSHLQDLYHEPTRALVSGTTGLDDLYEITRQASMHLAPGGWLIVEHGFDQALEVRVNMQKHGFKNVQSRQDLAGNDRCSAGQLCE